jgi:hypothetical protein
MGRPRSDVAPSSLTGIFGDDAGWKYSLELKKKDLGDAHLKKYYTPETKIGKPSGYGLPFASTTSTLPPVKTSPNKNATM